MDIQESSGPNSYDFIGVTDGTTIAVIEDDSIENVIYGGNTWATDDLISYGKSQGAHIGVTTFSTLESTGLLDFSQSGMSSSVESIAAYLEADKYNSQIVI